MMQHSLERPIRDGEIAYDVANDWFFNQRYSFLLTDEEQALVRQWQRDGRIVVSGRDVRMGDAT